MEKCGIILDFNDKIQIEVQKITQIRTLYPDCLLIGFLSSDFNHLGHPSRKDKYERTDIALKNTLDLIIEIPTALALQKVDDFALSLSKLIHHSKIDHLFLSSESMQRNALYQMAELPIKLDRLIHSSLSDFDIIPTISYTKGPFFNHDLLAIALVRYLNASNIKIHFIKHDHPSLDPSFEMEKYYLYLRPYLSLSSLEDLKSIVGIPDGFSKKLKEAAHQFTDYPSFLNALLTKYSQVHHIQKMLIQVLIQNQSIQPNSKIEPYLRILGFNTLGKTYLRTLKAEGQMIVSVFNQIPSPMKALHHQLRLAYSFGCSKESQKSLMDLELGSPIKKD